MARKKTEEDYEKQLRTESYNKILQTIELLKDFSKQISLPFTKETNKALFSILRKLGFKLNREQLDKVTKIYCTFDTEKKHQQYQDYITELIVYYENSLKQYR